jgi:PKD repeat protein
MKQMHLSQSLALNQAIATGPESYSLLNLLSMAKKKIMGLHAKRIIYYLVLAALVVLQMPLQAQTNTNPCSGLAKFEFAVDGGTVKFSSLPNTGTKPLFHHWRFGDGSGSDAANPIHTYNNNGTYRVVHYVKDTARNCYDSLVRELTITGVPVCPQPKFEIKRDINNPRSVTFYNVTGPLPTIYKFTWKFGDGTTSTEPNPTHVYSDTGTYNACLIIEQLNGLCKNYSCQTIIIRVPVCEIKPDFVWESAAANPLKVYFKNTSLPTTSPNVRFTWSFGDGTYSNEVNPQHGYEKPGIYKVCLKMQVVNSNCVKEICKEIIIRPGCENLYAKFEWKKDSLHPLRGVQFINLSSPLAGVQPRVKWDFGDGEGSNEWNPFHQYKCPGTYKVCLYVEFFPGCLKQYCTEIVIANPPCENLKPDFKWLTDAAHPLRGVKFINYSTIVCDTPRVRWNFGDGSAESFEWTPFHKYEQPGEYKVCLKVGWGNDCVKEICKTIIIPRPDADCEEISKFRFERITNDALGFYFVAKHRNPNWKYVWTFGDGKGALGDETKHRYEKAGKYTVCLTVYKSDDCASTTCAEVTAGRIPCDDVRLKFETVKGTEIPNRVKFIAISNAPLLNAKWVIYNSNAATNINPIILYGTEPTYTFREKGLYKVCLFANTVNGCYKQYCDTLRIDKVITPAECLLQIFPNPATKYIEFDVKSETAGLLVVNIYDINGIRRSQFMVAGQQGNNHLRFPVEALPAGYYYAEVIQKDGRVCKGKFQKL